MSEQEHLDWEMRSSLTDRVFIITGGAGLLGESHAWALSKAGGHAVIADIDGDRAVELALEITEATDARALGIRVDVSDPESVARMVRLTIENFGRLDGLVNNAALDPKFDPESATEHTNRFEDFPLEAWQQALDVNVTGMFLCAQAVAPIGGRDNPAVTPLPASDPDHQRIVVRRPSARRKLGVAVHDVHLRALGQHRAHQDVVQHL